MSMAAVRPGPMTDGASMQPMTGPTPTLTQRLLMRAYRGYQRVFTRPKFNSYHNTLGNTSMLHPQIPGELRELIERSLEIEPENWAFRRGFRQTAYARNEHLGIDLGWEGGARNLRVAFDMNGYGRDENWTAGVPGTWRRRITKRLEDMCEERWVEAFRMGAGKAQAKLELRNVGKGEPLPPQVIVGREGEYGRAVRPSVTVAIGGVAVASSPPFVGGAVGGIMGGGRAVSLLDMGHNDAADAMVYAQQSYMQQSKDRVEQVKKIAAEFAIDWAAIAEPAKNIAAREHEAKLAQGQWKLHETLKDLWT